jgi:GAF domain-containing protein
LIRGIDVAAIASSAGSVDAHARTAGGGATSKRTTTASKFKVMLRCLARTTAESCGVDRCSIFLAKDGWLVPIMSQFASGKARDDLWPLFLALGPSKVDEVPAFAKAIRQRRVITVRGAVWGTFAVASGLVVPLFGETAVIGVMVLDGNSRVTRDRIRRARVLARNVALAIERPVSAMEIRSQLRAAETLLRIGRTIGSTLELQEVVRRITRETAQALGADSAGIYLMSKRTNELEPFAGYHMPKELLDSIRRQPVPVVNPGDLQMYASDNVPSDPAFQHPIFRQFPAQSLILAPLRAQEEVVGMLVCAWWTERRRLALDERQLVEGIAAQAATAVLNARLYGDAAHAAIAAERIRLDNLLHDTFRQTLFSIGLRVERCLRAGQRMSSARPIIRAIKRDVALTMEQLNHLVPIDSTSPAFARSRDTRSRNLDV